MLKYVQMELDEGTLPDGTRYIAKDTLLARRAPQVPIGKDTTYGMGLMVDTKYGTPVVHHGGDMVGYPQRHDVAARAQRRRRHADERRIQAGFCARSSVASCSRCCSTAVRKPTPTWPRRPRASTTSSPPNASC